MYTSYKLEPVNPKTGFSSFLDYDHYTSELEYRNRLGIPTKANRVIEELRHEIMCLKAYGFSHADTRKILEVYRPGLKQVQKAAFTSILSRWCIYYAAHLKEFKRYIGQDWQAKAEQLIDFYEANKNKPSISTEYLNSPVTISNCVNDIRSMLEKLLLFTNLDVPVDHKIKELNIAEKEVKDKIDRCEDAELLNGYYAELLSILASKSEYRQNLPNGDQYRAVRILRTCGFVEAAYKWLDCFPRK